MENLLVLKSSQEVQSLVVPSFKSSQEVHVSKLPTKGVIIKEPVLYKRKASSVAHSSDKGKGTLVEHSYSDDSDDSHDSDEKYKDLPVDCWPVHKIEKYDRKLILKMVSEEDQQAAKDKEQVDSDEQHARILQDQEVLLALKERRSAEFQSKPVNTEVDYEPTDEEIDYLRRHNPEVSLRATQLIADQTFTPEEKTVKMKEFIRKLNIQAFEYVDGVIKKTQKKKRKATEAQIIKVMKQYLCRQAGWKMHYFKDMPNDMIRLKYYTAYKDNTTHRPIGSKEEAEWIKKQDEYMAAARERVKLGKTGEKSLANKRRKIVQDKANADTDKDDEPDKTEV